MVRSYLWFLRQISVQIVDKTTNDLIRETRKFNAVRKELSEFLIQHRKFYKIKTIILKSKEEILFSLDINDPEDSDNILKLEDMIQYDEKCTEALEPTIYYKIDREGEEIIETIKHKLGKSLITNADIPKFVENQFLVDKNDIGTKLSNYKELEVYINSRVESYYDEQVSTGHIENISFKFQGPNEDFEDEKSCAVCLEDYEEDQEVCRLPYNQFCCRNCIEKMFAVPQNCSKAHLDSTIYLNRLVELILIQND